MEKLIIDQPHFKDNLLVCTYRAGKGSYESSFTIPVENVDTDDDTLNKLAEWVAITGGFGLFSVAYFTDIETAFPLSPTEKIFFEKLSFLGLGEFRVVNKIPLDTKTTFSSPSANSSSRITSIPRTNKKPLLLNGGGKDGSVSAYILEKMAVKFCWFQRGASQSQQNVVATWHQPVLTSTRKLDDKRKSGPYSGHRPVSASIAFIALLTAYLGGNDSVIASNESSANEANYVENGISINHQYSKSLEFEQDLTQLLSEFQIPVEYFSLLRPLHELQIAIIATRLSDAQLAAITSCNHGTSNATWCMNCAKCAFVCLILTAADYKVAKIVWPGEGINTAELRPYLRQLLDPDLQKPFECVGTLEECVLAARILLANTAFTLKPETRQLLEEFTLDTSGDPYKDSLLSNFSEHLIPNNYMGSIGLFDRYIQDWLKNSQTSEQ